MINKVTSIRRILNMFKLFGTNNF